MDRRAGTRVCVRCLLGPLGAAAERRNNPLTKHGNINQHQSLERRPLAPTSRYCLHLHPARKNVMLDRDIDGPVRRLPVRSGSLSNATIDSMPLALSPVCSILFGDSVQCFSRLFARVSREICCFSFFFFLSWKGDEGFNRLTYNSFQPVKDVQFCSWRNCFLVHNNTLILRF